MGENSPEVTWKLGLVANDVGLLFKPEPVAVAPDV